MAEKRTIDEQLAIMKQQVAAGKNSENKDLGAADIPSVADSKIKSLGLRIQLLKEELGIIDGGIGKGLDEKRAYIAATGILNDITALVRERAELEGKDPALDIDYQIDAATGFQRIDYILEQRDRMEPAVLHDCEPEEVALTQKEVSKKTKVYVGLLFSGIFKKFPKLEHIYISFPNKKIERKDIFVGGETKNAVFDKLIEAEMKPNTWVAKVLRSSDFITSDKPKKVSTVTIELEDAGINTQVSFDEFCKLIRELGLELCPIEAMPYLALDLDVEVPYKLPFIVTKKSRFEVIKIVFSGTNSSEKVLAGEELYPSFKFQPNDRFVLRLPF